MDDARNFERLSEQMLAMQKAMVTSQIPKIDFASLYAEQLGRTVSMAVDKIDFSYTEQMRQVLAAALPKIDFDYSEQFRLALAGAIPKIDFDRYLEPLRAALAGFTELWEEARSPNWPDDIEAIEPIMELMRETGYCLVWAPRTEIITALMDAEPADRSNVLLRRREDILDDLDAVLADVDEPSLQHVRESAVEAIASFRDGHHRSAQALAAVILTDIIHANLGKRTSKALTLFEEQEPEEATIREHRLRTIFMVARGALATWWPLGKAPVPTDFNRHASLHRMTPEQYTEHNAVAGLMLVVPFLREVDALTKFMRAKEQVALSS